MRQLSLLFYPVACCIVLVLSSYLLLNRNRVAPIKSVHAFAVHKKAAHTAIFNRYLSPSPTSSRAVTLTPSQPSPTSTPTPAPTSTPIPPTNTPIPTKVVVPLATPTPTPQQTSSTASTDGVQAYLMQKINEYRSSQGLAPVTSNSSTCDFAKIRSQEAANSSSLSHDGFTNRISSHTLPYSSYHNVTENLAMTSDYKEVVPMWINSPGHAENMRADTPNVCVAQTGNYFAYEGWRP